MRSRRARIATSARFTMYGILGSGLVDIDSPLFVGRFAGDRSETLSEVAVYMGPGFWHLCGCLGQQSGHRIRTTSTAEETLAIDELKPEDVRCRRRQSSRKAIRVVG